MSQQHLKLTKNSQSAAQAANSYKDNCSKKDLPQNSYQDQKQNQQNQNPAKKSKGEVQTFQKKLQRRDLNLIPPSAAIVQSLQHHHEPRSTTNDNSNNRSGFQLTVTSTKNKNGTSAWDHIDHQLQSRVTTVKHEKGLPNGTIMQCLKQFQRSKQQRQANHQTNTNQQQDNNNVQIVSAKNNQGMTLNQVIPVASQNVANMPISTKSNKSHQTTKTRTQIANNASMAAEALAQRRQNFTCTTTTKGSIRLTKKSPSNGRDQTSVLVNHQNRAQHQQQQRDRSSNANKVVSSGATQNYQTHKNARGSTSQQHNTNNEKSNHNGQKPLKKNGANPEKMLNDMDFETKFAMLMRIREERSNESKPELLIGDSQKMNILMPHNANGGPYDPIKLIQPNTTTNRQSSQETKLLTLKNFQPAKQVSSNIVTPKYLKCKLGGGKQIQVVSDVNLNQHDGDHRHDMNYSKVQSKSQISTQNVNMDRHAGYKTTGISPDNKQTAQARIGRQSNQTKSLSNNSRQKYASQQQQQQSNIQIQGQVTKIVKPISKGGTLSIKHRDNTSNAAQKPTAPQMRYSQPPEQQSSKQTVPAAQAQQQVQSSSSALNGSSELQKRFTRGEIGSHHEASVSSGKANKSFQFGHNTALMSCSSGGDSSNPPQPVRRRSSSGKNGKQIKISHIQNVNPVIIQPGTSTSASIQNNDNSYLALQKQIPQSTTNNQKSGKRFTFATMGRDQQKASRPNKHSNNYQNSSTKNATNQKHLNAIASHQQHQTQHNHQHPGRDPSTQKSASKGKSVSAKKGKGQGVNSAATNSHAHATNQHSGNNTNSNSNAAATGKNINFDKPAKSSGNKHRGEHKIKVKTPDEMWYEQPKQSQIVKQVPSKAGQVKHSIPVHQSQQPSDSHHNTQNNNQRHQKLSNGSTPRSQLYPKDSKVSRHKKERISEDIVNMSYGDINQRDSVADESSQDISAITQPPQHGEDYQKLNSELQQKDNLIQQLYQALGRKEEQLNALSLNCEVLSTNLKARDEKRDKSQQAIKETLKSLEEKLQMFTAQSQHNKGGLQQITHSPYETNFLDSQMSQQMPQHSSYAEALDRQRHYQHQPNQTPNMSSAQRMEPYKLSYQNSTQPRPASGQLLQVPLQRGPTWDPANRRPSQISEIDSLVTVAEYNGTQCDGFKFDQSNYELSATKKDAPFIGEGTIGSLASEIHIINSKRESNLHGHKDNFPIFQKNGHGDVEELGEMTSVSEMEISNVHDASLDQLERDLMDTQQKLQEQSQKAAAFVKTQQNNFIDLKASMQAANERHAIQEVQEDTEEAEDDIAQLIPRKSGSQNLCQTQKVNLQKVKQQMSLLPESGPGEERKEMLTSTTTHQLNDQSDTYKSTSLGNVNSISHNSYQSKTSKNLSKNKMKLKLAAEILGLKKEQVACASDEERQVSGSTSLQRDKQNDSREKNKFSKKKIQLPLKIQKGSDSNRLVLQSKSQERGTVPSHHTGSALQNSVINSVTIRNIKNSVKISTTMEENDQNSTTRAFLQGQAQPNSLSNLSAKSPQSRQGVQVQGQGNMLSNRLSMKGKQAQPQVQKLDKLMANQLVLVSKLQHGQRTTTASGQTNFLLDAKAVPRKERRH